MMTIETRTTIEPGDVIGIEVQCGSCGARFVCAPNQWLAEPTGCRNCGASWAYVQNEIHQTEKFLAYLRLIADLQNKGTLPFKLRFEIAPPRKEAL